MLASKVKDLSDAKVMMERRMAKVGISIGGGSGGGDGDGLDDGSGGNVDDTIRLLQEQAETARRELQRVEEQRAEEEEAKNRQVDEVERRLLSTQEAANATIGQLRAQIARLSSDHEAEVMALRRQLESAEDALARAQQRGGGVGTERGTRESYREKESARSLTGPPRGYIAGGSSTIGTARRDRDRDRDSTRMSARDSGRGGPDSSRYDSDQFEADEDDDMHMMRGQGGGQGGMENRSPANSKQQDRQVVTDEGELVDPYDPGYMGTYDSSGAEANIAAAARRLDALDRRQRKRLTAAGVAGVGEECEESASVSAGASASTGYGGMSNSPVVGGSSSSSSSSRQTHAHNGGRRSADEVRQMLLAEESTRSGGLSASPPGNTGAGGGATRRSWTISKRR